MNRAARKSVGVLAAAMVLGAAGIAPLVTAGTATADSGNYFERISTYPVYQNHPDGKAAETASEISTVSEDGNTLIYSDALSRLIGFVDISDPSNLKGLGTLGLHQLGSPEDEPTSVAAYGDYVFVVVINTSESYANPSGRVDVVRIADRSLVRSIELVGQPDSIAISKDGGFAAIAIENERDEDAGDGGLPQFPAGSIQILDLVGAQPEGWNIREVALTSGTREEPAALPILQEAGFDTPQDPEPEYVTINAKNQLAVTLQENNGVVLIDLPTGEITKAFSAGSVDLKDIDIAEDGKLDPTGALKDLPREPDAIGWIQERYLATANEGDWKGGSRGFTIFDSETGKVVWDAGNSFEHLALSQGLFPEKRAGKKGTEPEGLAVENFHGIDYLFVASERGNFVAVYELSDPTNPTYLQTLPTTNGPEGILPIPGRDLLAVASETDEADNGVRSSMTLFKFGATEAQFPTIESDRKNLVPFGALSGLSADPSQPRKLFAVSDSAYEPRIYVINTEETPALVESSLPVTTEGAPATLDLEGLAARSDGGFWAAHEGKKGADNALIQIDEAGAVLNEVTLPENVVGQLGGQGLEGISVRGSGDQEEVIFTLQREVPGEDFVRIGKYTPANGEFTWYGYQLEPTGGDDSWNGLSEITELPDGKFAVIERDKRIGEDAQLKAIYQFELPDEVSDEVTMLDKALAKDVLPVLEATHGRTQEKLEGLTISGAGDVFVVTDNDAVDDASGETVFANLGSVSEVFGISEQPTDTESPQPSESAESSQTPTKSAEPTVTSETTQSPEPMETETESSQADASETKQSSTPSQTSSAHNEGERLADTGASSLWLIPVGLVMAGFGVAAAMKNSRSRREH
ncbi:esterase-like activity of phytase family protein [Glutamicibacter sp.]|uniref:esterase-like activity of phytase family protein n=1 Tax=Glutamicibacter sp. TaxID=1931995 RepID=UPI002B48057B|nr:esterase-like activity of phytase family protein [Glutamicibacter sp.]HJX79679.1 esterase-like activity of phytase family protein [Glutamicibacter sp.]